MTRSTRSLRLLRSRIFNRITQIVGRAASTSRPRSWSVPISPPSTDARFPAVDHDDGYFDERVAARYDESEGEMFDPAVVDPVVDFLVELAGNGRALELGIGTGRIALPLSQ